MNTKLIWRSQLVQVSDNDLDGVGNVRQSGGDVYRYVQNKDAGVALALGDIAYHKFSDGANMTKYVYQALTANLSVMAGVVVGTDGLAAYTTTSVSCGWIQIFGYNGSVNVSGGTIGGTNIVAGDYLKGVNVASYSVRDSVTQAMYARNIQILEAVTTTTTPIAAVKKGFINCI